MLEGGESRLSNIAFEHVPRVVPGRPRILRALQVGPRDEDVPAVDDDELVVEVRCRLRRARRSAELQVHQRCIETSADPQLLGIPEVIDRPINADDAVDVVDDDPHQQRIGRCARFACAAISPSPIRLTAWVSSSQTKKAISTSCLAKAMMSRAAAKMAGPSIAKETKRLHVDRMRGSGTEEWAIAAGLVSMLLKTVAATSDRPELYARAHALPPPPPVEATWTGAAGVKSPNHSTVS